MPAEKGERPAVQEMAVDAIRVDPDVQSRVSTSVEHMREFSEAMLRGEVFPAVVVFFDGQTHWLADGFHRVGAALRARFLTVRAEVRYGTRRDAMLHSAGANWRFSIPRKPEDVARAAEMLFRDEEWGRKTNQQIAAHLHASAGVVARLRVAYHERTGVPFPGEVTAADGKVLKVRHNRDRLVFDKELGQYRATVRGKTVFLGRDFKAARLQLQQLRSANARVRTEFPLLGPTRLAASALIPWLTSRGIAARVAVKENGHAWLRGATGIVAAGHLVTACQDPATHSPFAAVGALVLLRARLEWYGPVAVLTTDPMGSFVEAAKRAGIEVLTPEDFVQMHGPK